MQNHGTDSFCAVILHTCTLNVFNRFLFVCFFSGFFSFFFWDWGWGYCYFLLEDWQENVNVWLPERVSGAVDYLGLETIWTSIFFNDNFLLKFLAFVAVAFYVCCEVKLFCGLGNCLIFADISNWTLTLKFVNTTHKQAKAHISKIVFLF
jgi:hypothetical protein